MQGIWERVDVIINNGMKETGLYDKRIKNRRNLPFFVSMIRTLGLQVDERFCILAQGLISECCKIYKLRVHELLWFSEVAALSSG